jgi:hypothetical protein
VAEQDSEWPWEYADEGGWYNRFRFRRAGEGFELQVRKGDSDKWGVFDSDICEPWESPDKLKEFAKESPWIYENFRVIREPHTPPPAPQEADVDRLVELQWAIGSYYGIYPPLDELRQKARVFLENNAADKAKAK